ncbi:replication restart helicase PriA [Desulfotomaculum copahuensis]|uniref:Replication restart protein PriA n=1 Tax=Desulfotomaculum copahuensis TaxID=1838280 RepID=A0A1B7LEA7_9FIRM|nr:primosomal protein N' [Desulfotomaculum copahuensis]OAT81420.1 primosomal protein N' [Desulfotomaculum copahuensis]
MFAEVLVNLALRRVDKIFHYRVPAGLQGQVETGSRVLVPFGRRKLEGYVVGFGVPPQESGIKEVAALLDKGPLFTPGQLALARWVAAYYLCPLVSALQAMIWPLLQTAGPRRVRGLWPAAGVSGAPQTPKQNAVWQLAQNSPGLTRMELARRAGVSPGLVNSLVARGWLQVEEQMVRRDPVAGTPLRPSPPPVLNVPQAEAVREIAAALDREKEQVFLLHGITGSGKTEVYLRGIAAALERGRQAVALVPEIALTPQMVDVFRGRFGGRVAVLHSGLAAGERYDEYQRIQNGTAPVVLGARSAVFAPLDRPGLVIVDEEHESSYKQEETPRYHARAVALRLARQYGAVAVLGSATPALESYCRTLSGGPYRLLNLPYRIARRPLPPVRVVDLRREYRAGRRGIFSGALQEALAERLSRKEQAILFLNRRGYATFIVCRECGLVLKCPHCDISLTYHANGRLRCHYCNYSVLAPSRCPACTGRQMGFYGTGTQKVEQEVRRLFPAARVLRLDKDTTGRRGSHREILDAFGRGEADILIGTQMVAKGLDMPGVTLVGVVNADTTLHMPDFRASERTFQLLTQVAGRAGRGDRGGEVLVQTYSPAHYAVDAARRHDYGGFFSQEMSIRRALGYPPFSHLCRVLFTGASEEEVEKAAAALAGFAAGGAVQVMGPAPAPLVRVKDRFRWQLVLRADAPQKLREAVTAGLAGYERQLRTVAVAVDLDPQNMM